MIIINLFLYYFSSRQLIYSVSMCHTLAIVVATLFPHIYESEGIFYQSTFDLLVDGRIIIKTRSLIDLKKPGLQIIIQQDIKAQDLKTLMIIWNT